MAIFVPGLRDRHQRPLSGKGARNIVAMLSLTAMVDMFTVLAVFLLQNYQTTGDVIELSDEVVLPKAAKVRELKPATVVVISKGKILVDKLQVATIDEVKAIEEVTVLPNLQARVQDAFRILEERNRVAGLSQIRQAVSQGRGEDPARPEDFRRVTVQADRVIDAGTVKKVMYTLTEAGASEINFAVLRDDSRVQ
ncbi:MAG: biopolymer transporter ExbD [Deltaproteobacteria bacterium]|jgi:biopolymer transport protein ExbD|nr:biopolymer transporter ExbD [Deltaproteobacteria bacterium]